ncbi:hypothetical protein CSUI_002961, partial [Cystoisospora suis]
MTPSPPPPTSPLHVRLSSSSSNSVGDSSSCLTSQAFPLSPSYPRTSSSSSPYSSSAYEILPPLTSHAPPLSCRPVSLPSPGSTTTAGIIASKFHPPLLRYLLDSSLPSPPSSHSLSSLLVPRLSSIDDNIEAPNVPSTVAEARGGSSLSSSTRKSSSSFHSPPSLQREKESRSGASKDPENTTSPSLPSDEVDAVSSSPRCLRSSRHSTTSSSREGQPVLKVNDDVDGSKGSIETGCSPRRSSSRRSPVPSSSSTGSPCKSKETRADSHPTIQTNQHREDTSLATSTTSVSNVDADNSKKLSCYRGSPLLRRAAEHRDTFDVPSAGPAFSCESSQPVLIFPFFSLLQRSPNSLRSGLSSSVLRCRAATLQKDRLLRTAGVAIYRAVRAHALNILNIIEAHGIAAVRGALRRELQREERDRRKLSLVHDGFDSYWEESKRYGEGFVSPTLLPWDGKLSARSQDQKMGGVYTPQSLSSEADSDLSEDLSDDFYDEHADEDDVDSDSLSYMYGRGRRRGGGKQSSIFEFLPVIVASAGVYAADHRLAVQVLLLESIQRSMASWRRYIKNERRRKKKEDLPHGCDKADNRTRNTRTSSPSKDRSSPRLRMTPSSLSQSEDKQEGYFFFRCAILRPSDCPSVAAALKSIHRQFTSSSSSLLPPGGGNRGGGPYLSIRVVRASPRSSGSSKMVTKKGIDSSSFSSSPTYHTPSSSSFSGRKSFSPSKSLHSLKQEEAVKEEEEENEDESLHSPNKEKKAMLKKDSSSLLFSSLLDSSSSLPGLLLGGGEGGAKKGVGDLAAMSAWEDLQSRGWWRDLDLYGVHAHRKEKGGSHKKYGGKHRLGGVKGKETKSLIRTRRQRKYDDIWEGVTSSEDDQEDEDREEGMGRQGDLVNGEGVHEKLSKDLMEGKENEVHEGYSSPPLCLKEDSVLQTTSSLYPSTFFQPVSLLPSPPFPVGSAALLVVLEETEAFPPQLLNSLLQCLRLLRGTSELPLIVLTVVSSSSWGRQYLCSDVYTARGLAVETATLLRSSLIQAELLRVVITCPAFLGFEISSSSLQCFLNFIDDEAPSVLQIVRLLLGIMRSFSQFHPLSFICRGLDDVHALLRDLDKEEVAAEEEEDDRSSRRRRQGGGEEEQQDGKKPTKKEEKTGTDVRMNSVEKEEEEKMEKSLSTRRRRSPSNEKEERCDGRLSGVDEKKSVNGQKNEKKREEKDKDDDGHVGGRRRGDKEKVKHPHCVEEKKQKRREAVLSGSEGVSKKEGGGSPSGERTSESERDSCSQQAESEKILRLCRMSRRFLKKWKRRSELLCFSSLTEDYMKPLAQSLRSTSEVYVHLLAAQKNGFFFFDRCCWEQQQIHRREEAQLFLSDKPSALSRTSPLARRSRPFDEEEEEREKEKEGGESQQTILVKEEETGERRTQRKGRISLSSSSSSRVPDGCPSRPIPLGGGEQGSSSSSLPSSTSNSPTCSSSFSSSLQCLDNIRSPPVCRRSPGCVSRLAILDLLQRWWGGRGLLLLHRVNEEGGRLLHVRDGSSFGGTMRQKKEILTYPGGRREEDEESWADRQEEMLQEIHMALYCKEILPTALIELAERRIGICLGRRLLFLLDQTLQQCTRRTRHHPGEGEGTSRDTFFSPRPNSPHTKNSPLRTSHSSFGLSSPRLSATSSFPPSSPASPFTSPRPRRSNGSKGVREDPEACDPEEEEGKENKKTDRNTVGSSSRADGEEEEEEMSVESGGGEQDEDDEEAEGFFSYHDAAGEEVNLSSSRQVIGELDEILGIHEETACDPKKWNTQQRIQQSIEGMANASRKIADDLRRLIASKYDKLAVAAPARGGGASLLSRRGRLSTIDGDDNRHATASMSYIAPGEGNFADPNVLVSMLQAFLRQSTSELRLLHILFYSSLSLSSINPHDKTGGQDTSSQSKTLPCSSSFFSPSTNNLHALEVLRLFAELPTLIQELLESQPSSTSSSSSCRRSTFVTPPSAHHRFSLSSSLEPKSHGGGERLLENEAESKLRDSSYALNGGKSTEQQGGYRQSYVSPQLQLTNGNNDGKERLRNVLPEGPECQDKDLCKKRKSTAFLEKGKDGELDGLLNDSSHDSHRSVSTLTIDDDGHRGVGGRPMVSSKSRFLRWLEEALLLLLLPLPGWHPLGAELAVWGASLGMEFALNTGVLSTADDGLRGCHPCPSSLSFSSTNQLTLAAKSVCHMLRPHPQSDLLEHLAMINPFYLQQFQISSISGARKSGDALHGTSPSPLATGGMNSAREVCLEDVVILYRLINGEASGRRIGLWGLFCGFCRDVLKDRVQQEKLKRGEKQDEGGETQKNESCPSSTRGMQTRRATKISKREREAKKEKENKFVLDILQQMEDEGNHHHMSTTNTKGDPPSHSSGDTPGKESKVHRTDEDNPTSSTHVNGKTASRTTGRRRPHHVPLLQQLQLRFAIAVGALDHQLGVLRLPSASYSSGTERSFLTDAGERNDGVFSSERGLHPGDDMDSA